MRQLLIAVLVLWLGVGATIVGVLAFSGKVEDLRLGPAMLGWLALSVLILPRLLLAISRHRRSI